MCDGITQGRDGMQLSLFSRDVIAMATAIALSHDMFDAALLLGVCDKIVPGMLIGALALRAPADDLRAGRSDDLGSAERREGARSASCTPRARSAARSCSTPRRRRTTAGHLHVLRHRELQPDADGGRWACTCPAPSFVNPGHAAARCADRGSGQARSTALTASGERLHAGRPHRRREGHRQRLRRAARHRRLDQPHDAPRRDRPRRRHHADLGRPVRPVGRRAAAGPGLPQRQGRREPLPRRRRHGLRHRLAARRRPAARRRAHRRRRTGCAATRPSRSADGRRADLGAGHRAQPRHRRAARRRRPVRRRRRPARCSTATSAAP